MQMTVDAAYITQLSGYVLDTDFTQADLDRWNPLVTDQIEGEDPGFTSNQRLEGCALLICHRITLREKELQFQSEKYAGDYSYTRFADDAGKSKWIIEYDAMRNRILAARKIAGTTQPTHGAIRSDNIVATGFLLDENKLPRGGIHPDNTLQRYP